MHIPDGFLDLKTSASTLMISGVGLSYGIRKLKSTFEEDKIPVLGLLGAFIFAAQMINLPVAGGTSGHLIGGVLAMLVVGPWAASLIMTAITIIQAVFFMDGGLAVIGANILNLALIQVLAGYLIFLLLTKISKSIAFRTFTTAYLATVISAAAAALELALAGTIDLQVVLHAMVGWHLIIALIEAVITLLIINYLHRVAPEKLDFLQQKGGA